MEEEREGEEEIWDVTLWFEFEEEEEDFEGWGGFGGRLVLVGSLTCDEQGLS